MECLIIVQFWVRLNISVFANSHPFFWWNLLMYFFLNVNIFLKCKVCGCHLYSPPVKGNRTSCSTLTKSPWISLSPSFPKTNGVGAGLPELSLHHYSASGWKGVGGRHDHCLMAYSILAPSAQWGAAPTHTAWLPTWIDCLQTESISF